MTRATPVSGSFLFVLSRPPSFSARCLFLLSNTILYPPPRCPSTFWDTLTDFKCDETRSPGCSYYMVVDKYGHMCITHPDWHGNEFNALLKAGDIRYCQFRGIRRDRTDDDTYNDDYDATADYFWPTWQQRPSYYWLVWSEGSWTRNTVTHNNIVECYCGTGEFYPDQKWDNGEDDGKCQKCEKGTFSDANMRHCSSCEAGTYQGALGQGSCTPW